MSTDYTFYAIFGVQFSTKTEQFRDVGREPNCPHDPDPSVKFCPKCGKKVGSRETSYVTDKYYELRELDYPDGFAMVVDDHLDICTIGYGRAWDKYDPAVKLQEPDIAQIKATLVDILAPFGVYGENAFGFYAGVAAH